MTTSKLSKQQKDNSISLQEDFPVKISQLQGNKKESEKELDQDYFTSAFGYLGKFDLSSPSLKMLEIYSPLKKGGYSKKSSFKLPKQGLMLNGHLFQRQIWEPAIKEKECGSLPTPVANDANNRRAPYHQGGTPLLGRLLPTPVNSIWKDVGPKGSKSSVHQAKRGELCGVIKESTDSIPIGAPMYLNPFFVEEMMGYPVGWTA